MPIGPDIVLAGRKQAYPCQSLRVPWRACRRDPSGAVETAALADRRLRAYARRAGNAAWVSRVLLRLWGCDYRQT
jgi:hypothetical protein